MKKEKTEKAYKMDKVDRGVGIVFTILTWFSIIAVILITIITTVNVITRSFFSYPIFGAVDVSSLILSIVALCALPVVTMFNSHIKVDLVANSLKPKAQDVLTYFNLLICAAIMVLMSINTVSKAERVYKLGTTTGSLAIPFYPVYYLIAVMMMVSAACAVYNALHFAITGVTIEPDSFNKIKIRLAKGKGGE